MRNPMGISRSAFWLLVHLAWAGAARQHTFADDAGRRGREEPPKHIRVSTKPLAFSRAPTSDELMAAGQINERETKRISTIEETVRFIGDFLPLRRPSRAELSAPMVSGGF